MKRILSLLLATVLCLALMLNIAPCFAQAEDEPLTASPEPSCGQSIELPDNEGASAQPGQPASVGIDIASESEQPEMPWNDAFAKYVENRLYPEPDVRKNAAGDRLEGTNRAVYDALAAQITEVANGTRSSTIFPIPLEGLNLEDFDLSLVNNALVAVFP